MQRRQFISLIGGTAAWPIAARAQQAMPVVRFLSSRAPADTPREVTEFRQGLSEAGFVEGQNLAIAFRWAEGRFERLASLATELVALRVAVVVAFGGAPVAQAAEAATSTIPIVFQIGTNPVRMGLVQSLNRPGGNATGVTNLSGELGPKRLELLRELVPQAGTIAFLVNPTNPVTELDTQNLQAAGRGVGQQIIVLRASATSEIDAIFARLVEQRVSGLVINSDGFFTNRREQLVALAARYSVPTSYWDRTFVEVGGLMSYGTDGLDLYHQAGRYVGRILKGDKPADLPVMQPTNFQFAINLKTAKALGLTVPPTLFALADEIIE